MNARYIDNLRPRWLRAAALCAVLLQASGCVTITPPVEEPSPLEPLIPSATPAESGMLYSTTTSIAPSGSERSSARFEARPTRRPRRATPSATPTPEFTPTATPEPTFYEVVAGDTLSVIAKKFAISVNALMAANSLTDADTLSVGQKIIIPSASEIVAVVAQQGTPIPTPQTESGELLHYIQVGETLSGIAARYQIDRDDLLMANGLRPDALLIAGNTLIVPQGEYVAIPTATAVPPTQVPTVELARSPSVTSTPTAPATPTTTVTPAPAIYTVKEGDYARVIAESHGITLDQLRGANPGVSMEALSIGQQLVLPSTSGASGATATPTAAIIEPTATATAVAPIMATHIVVEGETVATLADQYGLSVDNIRAHNASITGTVTDTLAVDTVVNIPLGTATPVPSPTPPPTFTPTPAPEYLAPILLLPPNGSTLTHTADQAPLQLVWTATGILKDEEFYVVRLRALDPDSGDVKWTETHWTKNPSWRLDAALIDRLTGTLRLRWDVMVMRRTGSADNGIPTGVGLSEKSPTFELLFINTK